METAIEGRYYRDFLLFMGCLTHLKSTVSVEMFLTCVNSLGASNLSEIIRPVQFPDVTLPLLTSTEVWWELLPENLVPLYTLNPCMHFSTHYAHRQQLSGSNLVRDFRRQWHLYISQLNILSCTLVILDCNFKSRKALCIELFIGALSTITMFYIPNHWRMPFYTFCCS